MKILKKGQSAPLNWWVGAKLTCVTCGQEVELEKGDCGIFLLGVHRVVPTCQNCGGDMPLVYMGTDIKAAYTAASI